MSALIGGLIIIMIANLPAIIKKEKNKRKI
jgi:hypothetical protein